MIHLGAVYPVCSKRKDTLLGLRTDNRPIITQLIHVWSSDATRSKPPDLVCFIIIKDIKDQEAEAASAFNLPAGLESSQSQTSEHTLLRLPAPP